MDTISMSQTSIFYNLLDKDGGIIQPFSLPKDKAEESQVCSEDDFQLNIKNPRKMKWTPEEDLMLSRSIRKHGTGNWTLIASEIPGRNGKQCRERWTNQINPQLIREKWDAREDALIIQYQSALGNAWSKIARFLPGRSGNAVKNRYMYLMKQRLTPIKNALYSRMIRSSTPKPKKVKKEEKTKEEIFSDCEFSYSFQDWNF